MKELQEVETMGPQATVNPKLLKFKDVSELFKELIAFLKRRYVVQEVLSWYETVLSVAAPKYCGGTNPSGPEVAAKVEDLKKKLAKQLGYDPFSIGFTAVGVVHTAGGGRTYKLTPDADLAAFRAEKGNKMLSLIESVPESSGVSKNSFIPAGIDSRELANSLPEASREATMNFFAEVFKVATDRWTEGAQVFGESNAMSTGLKYELQTDVQGNYSFIEAKEGSTVLHTFPALVVYQWDRKKPVVQLKEFMISMNSAMQQVLGAAGLTEREEQSLKESHLVEVTTVVPPRPTSGQASLIGAGSGFYKNQYPFSDCFVYLLKFARMIWAGEIYFQKAQLFTKEEAVPITKLVVNVSSVVFIMAHMLSTNN